MPKSITDTKPKHPKRWSGLLKTSKLGRIQFKFDSIKSKKICGLKKITRLPNAKFVAMKPTCSIKSS